MCRSIQGGEFPYLTGRYRVGMPEQKKVSSSGGRESAVEAEESRIGAATNDDGRRLAEEIDDLLDEIDEVLETNAEEFVKNYVQKGGE